MHLQPDVVVLGEVAAGTDEIVGTMHRDGWTERWAHPFAVSRPVLQQSATAGDVVLPRCRLQRHRVVAVRVG